MHCPEPGEMYIPQMENGTWNVRIDSEFGESNWDLEVVIGDDANPTGIPTHENVSSEFQLADMIDNNHYKIYYRVDCNGDNSETSEWKLVRACKHIFTHGNYFSAWSDLLSKNIVGIEYVANNRLIVDDFTTAVGGLLGWWVGYYLNDVYV